MDKVNVYSTSNLQLHNNLQGFLKHPPVLAFNLKPNKDGIFEVKNVDFSKYSSISIIVSDQFNQLSQKKFNVSDNTPFETKDLRLLNPLDSSKFYNEVRNSFTLKKGAHPLEINDISATQIQIIECLEKALILIENHLKQSGNNGGLNELKFLINWNTYDEE